MKVVINTSPLISLGVLNQLELLNKLFPQVIVPPAVYQEIEVEKKKRESDKILNFIAKRLLYPKKERELTLELGAGETEAIILCLELNADLLIIDDKKARNTAESYNIKCIGTLGVLTLAKKRGYIEELKKFFFQLLENKRYFSVDLLNEILQVNLESPL